MRPFREHWARQETDDIGKVSVQLQKVILIILVCNVNLNVNIPSFVVFYILYLTLYTARWRMELLGSFGYLYLCGFFWRLDMLERREDDLDCCYWLVIIVRC
jgi:hypothetical protein